MAAVRNEKIVTRTLSRGPLASALPAQNLHGEMIEDIVGKERSRFKERKGFSPGGELGMAGSGELG